jgi:hypothetical protein
VGFGVGTGVGLQWELDVHALHADAVIIYEWQHVEMQFGHFFSQSLLQHSLWHVDGVGLGVGAGVGIHFASVVHAEQALSVWMYSWQHCASHFGHFVAQSGLQHSLPQSACEDASNVNIKSAHAIKSWYGFPMVDASFLWQVRRISE